MFLGTGSGRTSPESLFFFDREPCASPRHRLGGQTLLGNHLANARYSNLLHPNTF